MSAVLALAGAAMLAAAMVPSTAAAAAVRPVVVSFTAAAPKLLSAKGTRVALRARVRRASTCIFLRRLPYDGEFTPVKTVRCSSGSATAIVAPVANTYTAKVRLAYRLVARASGGTTAQATLTLVQAAAAATTSPSPQPRQSVNWSGYELPSSSPVTAVSGTFTVPTLDCTTTPDAGVTVWVGTGGDDTHEGSSDGALLQTGVEAVCNGGSQYSETWWELYPNDPNTAVPLQTVQAGDQIFASVTQTASGWGTVVNDVTRGYGKTVASADAGYSYGGGFTAEWIVEAYSEPVAGGGSTQATLAAYGSVAFTNCGTSLASWSLADANPITIVQSGKTLSTPGAPSGNGFTARYTG